MAWESGIRKEKGFPCEQLLTWNSGRWGGGGIIKVKENHSVTEELGPSKVEIDCFFFRKDQSKFCERHIYVLPIITRIICCKRFICDFKVRTVKNTKRKDVPSRQIWNLL